MGDMDCQNLLKITLARKYRDSPISEISHGHGETGKNCEVQEKKVLQAYTVHFASTLTIASGTRFKIRLDWRVERAFWRLK